MGFFAKTTMVVIQKQADGFAHKICKLLKLHIF